METQVNPVAGTLAAVLEYGQRAGYWRVLPRLENQSPTYATVEDGEGLRFWLSARDGQIRINVDSLGHSAGIRVMPSEVTRHDEPNPSGAGCSISRGPDSIAKSLHARCVADKTHRDIARRVRERYAQHLAQRAELERMTAELFAQGWRMMGGYTELPARECHEVALYGPGTGLQARVNASGSVYVDRLTVRFADLGAVVELAKAAR